MSHYGDCYRADELEALRQHDQARKEVRELLEHVTKNPDAYSSVNIFENLILTLWDKGVLNYDNIRHSILER